MKILIFLLVHLELLQATLINANVTYTSNSLKPYWLCLEVLPPKAVSLAELWIIRRLVKNLKGKFQKLGIQEILRGR